MISSHITKKSSVKILSPIIRKETLRPPELLETSLSGEETETLPTLSSPVFPVERKIIELSGDH